MTTSIPTDINDEMPIPKGMTVKDEILNGVKTVYTAGENERRVDKLQLNGTLSVDRGDEVPKGEYNTKVVLTLVQ